MPSAIPDIKKKKNKRKKPLTIKKITFSVYEDILRQFRYIQDKSVNSSENCVFCTVEQWKKYKGEFFIEKYFLVKVDNESQEIKRKKKKKVVLFYFRSNQNKIGETGEVKGVFVHLELMRNVFGVHEICLSITVHFYFAIYARGRLFTWMNIQEQFGKCNGNGWLNVCLTSKNH